MDEGKNHFGDMDESDDDGPADARAVTCRYDMAKLRRIGELEDEVLEWLGEERGVDVDDLEVLFNVEQALHMTDDELVAYMTEIVSSTGLGDKVQKFIDQFKKEIEALRNFGDDPKK